MPAVLGSAVAKSIVAVVLHACLLPIALQYPGRLQRDTSNLCAEFGRSIRPWRCPLSILLPYRDCLCDRDSLQDAL